MFQLGKFGFTAKNTVTSTNFLVWILCKATVSPEFQVNRQKLYGNCVFLQNFQTRKLGKITVFFALFDSWCDTSLGVYLEPVEHLLWRFFAKIVNGFKPLDIFAKKLHCRCLSGF